MLQAIRDGVKGWIAWMVIGLIALPFVFLGGYDYFTGGGGSDAVVAKIDGNEIVRQEVDRAVEQRRMRLREIFGGDLPEDAFDEGTMRREALQGLIDERLLQRFVAEQNLRVSDEEIARTIRNQQAFYVDGQFSRQRYRTLLQRNRLTPEQYESLIRRDLLVGQFEEVVQQSSLVPSSQVEILISLQREKRSFDYVKLAAESFADEVEIGAADLEQYYEEHKGDYMTPEAVQLDYIEVQEGELNDAGKIDEMANTAFERPQSLEPAAEIVRQQIKHSGWVPRKGGEEGLAQYPAVVEAAFSEDVLKHDYNSELIEVADGRFFIVRKAAHRQAEPKTLSAVKDQVRKRLRRERALDLADQEAEQLVASLEAGEVALGEYAEENSYELVSVDSVMRNTTSHPQSVVERAFMLGKGGAAKVALDQRAVTVVYLNGISPGEPQEMEPAQRRNITQQMEQMAARMDMQAFVQALREDANIEINNQRL